MGNEKGLPANWRERIEGKKVVLYNTGVASLLNGGEKHIEKIAQVLDIFRSQSEVVLWWRPHPLELTTVASMRPDLAKKYESVRRSYEKENWGILDTSADVHRAIAVSDAYYGDWSSLIHLYKATGKPILLSNDDALRECDKNSLVVQDFVIIGNFLWFISATMNMLFCMKLENFEVEEAIKIPYGNIFDMYVTYRIVNVGEYLILIPGCGKWVIRFRIQDKKFDKVDVGNWSNSTKFGAYSVNNGYVYAVPAFDNRLIKYDVEENKIVDEIVLTDNKNELFLETNIYCNDEYIYAVKSADNCMYKYSVSKDSYEIIRLIGEEFKLGSINKVGSSFLLTSRNKNELILWDESRNETTKMELPCEFILGGIPYSDIVVYGNQAFLFPNSSNMILKADLNNLSVCKYLEYERNEQVNKESYFTCAKLFGNRIYAFNNIENNWVVIEPDTNMVETYNAELSGNVTDIIKEQFLFGTDNLEERPFFERENVYFYTLHNFLASVTHEKTDVGSKVEKKRCGEYIHKKMTEQI